MLYGKGERALNRFSLKIDISAEEKDEKASPDHEQQLFPRDKEDAVPAADIHH